MYNSKLPNGMPLQVGIRQAGNPPPHIIFSGFQEEHVDFAVSTCCVFRLHVEKAERPVILEVIAMLRFLLKKVLPDGQKRQKGLLVTKNDGKIW